MLQTFFSHEEGQSAVEFAVILMLVGLAIVASLSPLSLAFAGQITAVGGH